MLGAFRVQVRSPSNQARRLRPRTMLYTAVVALALTDAVGCGGDDDYAIDEQPPVPSGDVEVTVEFPGEREQSATAALHLWALDREEHPEVTCARLIGGDDDPYDMTVVAHADVVQTDPSEVVEAQDVEVGTVLLYVEAVDYRGEVLWAGCTSTTVEEGLTSSETVTLVTARVYDCDDDDTEDGAPCDDGDFCTVDETCYDGRCGRGVERDCEHLDDQCNVGTCDEELGCHRTPLPDNEDCDDDRVCTEGDRCVDGRCVGEPVDCTESLGMCEVTLGCREPGGCIVDFADSGTPCDDQDLCTEDDQCNGLGTCLGATPVDCSDLDDECVQGVCNPTDGSCEAQNLPNLTSCDDGLSCTQIDRCDGDGNCVGGTPRDCSGLDDQCNTGVCVEPDGTCDTEPLPDTTTCDDQNLCTTVDACDGSGNCVGSSPLDCTPATNACFTGNCFPTSGCEVDVGMSCSDGLACTDNDVCTSTGDCTGTATTCTGPCDVGGTCSEPDGCEKYPEGTLCGTLDTDCSTTCDATGECVAAAAPEGTSCGAASTCSACDASQVCVAASAEDGTPCDDLSSTTTDDQCTGGVCSGT